MTAIYLFVLNKCFFSKFLQDYQVRQTAEEGWWLQKSKRCEYNKDEDTSPDLKSCNNGCILPSQSPFRILLTSMIISLIKKKLSTRSSESVVEGFTKNNIKNSIKLST